MESNAFKDADFIMFPCIGAREPYEKEPMIKKVFEDCKDKFFYVPTSIVDYKPDLPTCQKLSELGIPKGAFVVSYFGRHITVKGYDILIKFGMRLIENNPNLYFLCAGSGPIEPPKHPRWIELGFIKNVDDLLPQCNLYILPNRETYFDLITLQILRAGIPLILSDTGGNKYFKDLPQTETKGLKFFDIGDENTLLKLVQGVINLYSSNQKEYENRRVANRNLYEKYFTIDRYVKEYTSFIDKL